MTSMITRKAILAASVLVLGVATLPVMAYTINWIYKDPLSTTANPVFREFFADNVKYDLPGYARFKYGPSAQVILVENNVYGWRIRHRRTGQWRVEGINMHDAARWMGERRWPFPHRLKNWGHYYIRFNDPHSWRAAFIVKCHASVCR
jgi:hypothetical protein